MKLSLPRPASRALRVPLMRNLPVRPVGDPAVPEDPLAAAVDWALYVEGVRQPGGDFAEACTLAERGKGFLWLGLFEPSVAQVNGLGRIFGLHPLALEDASGTRQRPKLERDDDGTIFLSLRTIGYVESAVRSEGGEIVETGSATVFAGEWFAVTVRRGRDGELQPVRHQLEENPRQLARGPIAVMVTACWLLYRNFRRQRWL